MYFASQYSMYRYYHFQIQNELIRQACLNNKQRRANQFPYSLSSFTFGLRSEDGSQNDSRFEIYHSFECMLSDPNPNLRYIIQFSRYPASRRHLLSRLPSANCREVPQSVLWQPKISFLRSPSIILGYSDTKQRRA